MKIFDVLKKRGFSDVFALGLRYSTNKLEFEEFAPKAWKIGGGDYLRAIVATAYLLNNKAEDKVHDLHTLDFVYGDLNGDGNALIHPIYLFFDDQDGKLTKVYREHLADYREIEEMHQDLKKVQFSSFIPLVKSTNFCKLMSYNNQKVLISTVDGASKKVTRQVSKFRLFGTDSAKSNIRCGGQFRKLFGLNDGVLSIQDPITYETLFQNVYVDSDHLSDIQKTGFIYGKEKAREFYATRSKELKSKEFHVEPHRRNSDEFFGESGI